MPKILSLIPSGTEIVCALGLQEHLVGRSHECDFPPTISHLPICTEPSITVSSTSQEIHDRVTQRLKDALSIYRVNTDILQSLQPDYIVTQTQCDVCAVSFTDVEKSLTSLVNSQPTLISLQAADLQGVWDDVQRVAHVLGKVDEGKKILEEFFSRISVIQNHLSQIPTRPAVACIEWMDPLMAAGNWVPELVDMAGGSSVFGKPGEHAPWITWDALHNTNPDILVLMPCGFSMARIEEEISLLTEHPLWESLPAVQTGRVYLTDGNQFFNRPGPRLMESLEILAEIFHPTLFRFGHKGTGWRPFGAR